MSSRAASILRPVVAFLVLLFVAAGGVNAATPAPVLASHGMVATAEHLATEVGVDVLRHGGNAVDAAVAVGYALAVVDPCCGNLGGGGFMTLHLADGKNLFLNFREKAPLAASANMYLGPHGEVEQGKSLWSWQAIGVPGTVMGLDAALSRYGTMSRAEVMAPAIRLAREGYVLEAGDAALFAAGAERLARDPTTARIFLPHGHVPRAGERFQQPELARTLELISRDGDKAFYEGPIAKEIVAASKANGGILSRKDFHAYTVEWEQPVACEYRGYEIVSAPPPSSGGVTLCEILNVLAGWPDFAGYEWHSVPAVHDMVEAMRFAYADRNGYLGDPDFVNVPVAKLLSARHAAAIRARIPADRAVPSSSIHVDLAPAEGTHTTHYSIVDAKGNAVGVTYTLNSWFGTGFVASGTGFLL
ncbi:MAG TPA: gamma-glutamyltransferase, partial [Gammaproteobacteria bacterium]|nr:gamma-glutamyltransferase [Gammaproteobacteria bacterium]